MGFTKYTLDIDHRPIVLTGQTLYMMRLKQSKESRHWQEPVLEPKTLEEKTSRDELYQEISNIFFILYHTK